MKKNSLSNIKNRLNFTLIFTIFISLIVSIFVLKSVVYEFAILSNVDTARLMSKQLIHTRNYLSEVVPNTILENKNIHKFALAPAYVGGQISSRMLELENFYIKQTSLKYRSSANAPDKFEKKVLLKYKKEEIEGEYYELTNLNNREHLRYTYPLYITDNCLKCHGKPYVDVKEKIYNDMIEVYGDKAFNYKLGDFRGMISIAIDTQIIKQASNSINKNMIYIFLFLFIIIIVLILLELKLIFNPQLQRIEDNSKVQENQKNYLDIVIESNNNAIIAIDNTRTILTYNKKAQDIFGFTKEEMIGTKNLTNIIPLKYKNLHDVASALYFKTGKSNGLINTTMELEGLCKDGTIIAIKISFGTNNNTNHPIVIANISDISKEKKQEELLRQQTRLAQMGEMINMIAHQWRQPLGAISSAVFSIQMKRESGRFNFEREEDRVEYLTFEDKKLKNISGYVEVLSSTIDDFRNFFKPDKEKESLDITTPIQRALHIVEPSMQSRNIVIELDYMTHDLVSIYQNEMMQVILNILKNAEDNFIEKKIQNPKINIFSKKENNNYIISICDNGGGIPSDILINIFDPYFSTKGDKDGTGIGLYMSKTMIEKHLDGTLSVENIDDGACFSIIFQNS